MDRIKIKFATEIEQCAVAAPPDALIEDVLQTAYDNLESKGDIKYKIGSVPFSLVQDKTTEDISDVAPTILKLFGLSITNEGPYQDSP